MLSRIFTTFDMGVVSNSYREYQSNDYAMGMENLFSLALVILNSAQFSKNFAIFVSEAAHARS